MASQLIVVYVTSMNPVTEHATSLSSPCFPPSSCSSSEAVKVQAMDVSFLQNLELLLTEALSYLETRKVIFFFFKKMHWTI